MVEGKLRRSCASDHVSLMSQLSPDHNLEEGGCWWLEKIEMSWAGTAKCGRRLMREVAGGDRAVLAK